ncbi:MAG: rRNA maturation RNase YbeY [Nitrospinaceae bacterium]|nr:rRNA maturation RNase YbeY [Nitrospinaceae bacterium]NIR54653.1 rRNA maturation RNase YbeY [Nitrospinaceae bacterium]NIS85070.1 rRNA maturation RNase YbeY [Nitrospinaceae bacterium]NIT81887.1 rRNA maturation RNase YbeY [Nitrospinaceae bacterium]NIU44151.1 rRNA maturation RNase YbeY [Nitrospinaceae bacterium]
MKILIQNNQSRHPLDESSLQAQIAHILELLETGNCELSLLLTDDLEIQQLNRTYRNIDQATDVLAFPQDEDAVNESGDTLLGDVVISTETAARQAADHDLGFNEELILLAIHGILHLLGYDHERSPQDARIMQDKTLKVFQALFPGRRPAGTSDF